MSGLNIPEPLLDALLEVANDFMEEKEFDSILGTDWTSREKAGPAWKQINLCLQKVSKSPFPGPKDAMFSLQKTLSQYQLKFDGERISRVSS
ncbi:MAG: hypothetical protein HRU19_31820 [Pseudobacteriovorax sp.]|nr:hypothetical protein [Pseudobacteriovorax sp.]